MNKLADRQSFRPPTWLPPLGTKLWPVTLTALFAIGVTAMSFGPSPGHLIALLGLFFWWLLGVPFDPHTLYVNAQGIHRAHPTFHRKMLTTPWDDVVTVERKPDGSLNLIAVHTPTVTLHASIVAQPAFQRAVLAHVPAAIPSSRRSPPP